MKTRKLLTIILSGLLLTACAQKQSSEVITSAGDNSHNIESTSPTQTETTSSKDAESDRIDIVSDFEISTEDGTFTIDGSTYKITSAGTYKLNGKLPEGTIVIDSNSDNDIILELNNVSITSSTSSPINCIQAKEVKLKALEGTFNEITDARDTKNDDSDDTNAAIYATCDLSLVGKGSLVVSSTYNNGVQSKETLSIKNQTLKVTAQNNSLKGNEGVEIDSGDIILIAKSGDGIKTSDSDISSKGNQKGNIIINGGNIDIYSCCDGISSAYNVEIATENSINIHTDKYSNYTEGPNESANEFFLILNSKDYSESNLYYAYFYNDDYSAGVWKKATFSTMISGGRTRYYGLSFDAPQNYTNVQYFIFDNGTEPNTSNYYAASDYSAFNTAQNAYYCESINSTNQTISGDYTQVTMNAGTNSSKSTYSTKGIKAENEIIINNGNIVIECSDDGIHANGDTLTGNITVNGGSLTIKCADDGIHADNEVVINSGVINITSSYEGIEGNQITVNDGSIYVYASDDGFNACSGNNSPLITFNGGYVDVTTPTGDTDGIDSNGSILMTGGVLIVKGGNSSGNVAGSIDTDGTIKVTGGTIIALGGICETPATGSVNGYVAASTSFTEGEYELKASNGDVIISFSLSGNYTNAWFSSDKFVTGTSYSLNKNNTQIISWTQENGTMNASSNGFGGGGFGGGFGGGPHGGRR